MRYNDMVINQRTTFIFFILKVLNLVCIFCMKFIRIMGCRVCAFACFVSKYTHWISLKFGVQYFLASVISF
jgi:hypothetical protein